MNNAHDIFELGAASEPTRTGEGPSPESLSPRRWAASAALARASGSTGPDASRAKGEYYRLAPEVTVTVSAGRAVFLDVARDRYTMLPSAQNAAFVSWLGERSTPLPAVCRSALAQRFGLDDECIEPHRVSVAVPSNVIGTRLPAVRAGLSDVIAVAHAVIRARRMLQGQSLRTNLEQRRDALARRPRATHPSAISLAATYHAVRHFIPAPRVCLLDSLALIDWLGDAHEGVQLVFGVTAYPFGAHCWVQTRAALLGDEPDTIGRYAPILHIGE